MRHHLLMMPIVDAEGRIKGVVNVNDIVQVVQEEATEDIQKIGGVATLEGPYLQIPLLLMIRKRAGWLAALFLGRCSPLLPWANFRLRSLGRWSWRCLCR